MQYKNATLVLYILLYVLLYVLLIIILIALLLSISLLISRYKEGFESNNKKINIVYFAFIPNNKKDRWTFLIKSQLNDLINSKLLNESKLYVVLSIKNPQEYNDVKTFINSILSGHDYEISYTFENNYEYPGIKKLYDLAKISPNNYYLYLHSKGMVFHEDTDNKRDHWEERVTYDTIYKWVDITNIFKNNEHITRIGLFPAHAGWVWINIFWVKGTYLIQCEEPIITSNRHYYEGWLGTNKNKELTESYSIYSNDKTLYNPDDVARILQ
jgi:hypothetical protein